MKLLKPYMNDILKIQSKKSFITFILISLLVLLFIRQDEMVSVGSIKYWLIILPPLLLALVNFQSIILNICTKTLPILLMVILSCAWYIFLGQNQGLNRLVLFLLMFALLQLDDAKIKVKALSYIYVIAILFSILIYFNMDINKWGLIPGTTTNGLSVWRVSFFPNIANSAFYSLFMFIVYTKDKETFLENKGMACLSLYFTLFSFVRCALVSLVLYLFLYAFFKKIKSSKALFLYSILAAILVNIIIVFSSDIIYAMQSLPYIDRILLRGEQTLSEQAIYVQMYRPWVWNEQWNIFVNSPWFMGEGVYDFNALKTSHIRGIDYEESDSVSLLLGMLAAYGLLVIFFFYFILKKNFHNAMALDKWACAIFPVIIFIGMQWGVIFHPATPMFLMYFLILFQGKKAFI